MSEAPQSSHAPPPRASLARLRNALITALSHANEAVNLDSEGRPGAIEQYEIAIEHLKKIIPHVDDQYTEELIEVYEAYTERMTRLKTEPPPNPRQMISRNPPIPAFPFNESIDTRPLEPAPEDPAQRTFWLMGLINATLVSGGWLSEGVFVPKIVWYQEGGIAQLHNVKAKIKLIEDITQLLTSLERVRVESWEERSAALDAFLTQAKMHGTTYKNGGKSIEKRLGKLFERGSRLMGGTAKKGQPSEEEYVPMLIALFHHAQVIERWMQTCTPDAGVMERLTNISAFLYAHVCSFVLADLSTLLQFYLHNTREEVVKTVPSAYQAR